VAKTLEAYLDQPCHIKWINDIYYKNKKVSGVISTAYNEEIHVGIGVNLNAAPIEKAGSLSD
jgi:biotin-(acetyl-CoA carboxylase) ligase